MATISYIDTEVKKITADEKHAYPLNYAFASSWLIANSKGINIKIFDVSQTSSLSDYFIIGTVENIIQARTLADTIDDQMRKNGIKNITIEGKEDAEWILIDAGDIIVHIFLENIREIYDLDSLWKDHPQVKIPQEYYFQEPDASTQELNENEYF